MSYMFTSGNETVDAIGFINFTGNVIPLTWYKTILRENGRPHLLAITLLADIRYWYTPTEIRDEASGQLVGWKKKFHADMLQKNYQQLADQFGESKIVVKRAMDLLEEIGAIKRHFREVQLANGNRLSNVMYIELCAEKLKELTFPEEYPKQTHNGSELELPDCSNRLMKDTSNPKGQKEPMIHPVERSLQKSKEVFTNLEGPSLQKSKHPLTNLEGSSLRKSKEILTNPEGVSLQICGESPYEFDQYTKNTTESTTQNTGEDTIHPIYQTGSEMAEEIDSMEKVTLYRELIKKNIALEALLHDRPNDASTILELYETICDIVCFKRNAVNINSTTYPWEIVQAQFLKLSQMHVSYVLDCLNNTIGKIGNIRAYMITALYNSLNTMDNYYRQRVAHDMYGGG